MSENFRKIKKKYTTVAIVAGCILGACLGVALTCTLAVILKSCAVNFFWALYIPIALALSAGAGYLFYLILRPDDNRIAKKLDRDYALNQKVQTMVEYAGVEGAMPALQREQTDEVLGGVAKKRVDLKWLAKFAAVPVIAVAMLFAGIFVPAKKSAGYVDPVFDITIAQETALKNLIADVEGSSLETDLKTSTVDVLDGLLDMLKSAEYQSTMKKAVISSVQFIDALVANSNSYLKIDGVLKADEEQTKPFSEAIVNAVVNYKYGASLTSMRAVKEMESNADRRITTVLEGWKTTYLLGYAPVAEGAEVGTPIAPLDAAIKLQAFADSLSSGLADSRLQGFAPNSGEEQPANRAAYAGDPFYNRLTALAANLSGLAESVLTDSSGANGGYDAASYYAAIDGYFGGFIEDGAFMLSTQSYGCMMDDYLRNALAKIFGMSRSEFGSNAHVAPDPTDDGNSGSGDRQESDGGYGDGVHTYGSNDEILDITTGEKKKYSDRTDPDNPDSETYLDQYYNRAMEYIQSGACPAEVAAYIRQYFAYLNSGIDDNQN